MRKVLLCTTALAAFGTAGECAAADGLRLSLGGRYIGAAGIVVAEDFSSSAGAVGRDIRPYAFKQDVEIRIHGEVVLDNGLAVGATIDLEGQTSEDDRVSAVYASFAGGFGEIRFGDTDEAYAEFCYLAPRASELFGADSPDFSFSNAGIAGYGATNGTCYGIDDQSTKLVYFSPVFGGFQFGLSFTPDGTEDTRNVEDGAGTRFRNDPDQNSDNLSLAGKFDREVGGVALILGGGANLSFDKEVDPAGTGEARSFNAYARAAFSGFTFGAAAEWRENLGSDGSDHWVAGVGATYGGEGWTVGLGWTRGDYEGVVGANGLGPFDAVQDIWALTASMSLGPGVAVDGVVEYSDSRSRESAGPDYQGLAVAVGTRIDF